MSAVRACGACRSPIRRDESLSTRLLAGPCGTGFYQCCPRCAASADGVEPPAPRKYPAGCVPRDPFRNDLLPVCGLCREALLDGERCSPIRLVAEDLTDEPATEPGAYCCCPRCVSRWRPVVVARWRREGVIPEGAAGPKELL